MPAFLYLLMYHKILDECVSQFCVKENCHELSNSSNLIIKYSVFISDRDSDRGRAGLMGRGHNTGEQVGISVVYGIR